MKTVHLYQITEKEWEQFRVKCLKNKTTMTQVLLRAVREYLKGGEK